MSISQSLIDAFYRYVAITSQSDAKANQVPSTQGQFELVKLLEKDLHELGFTQTQITEHGILIAKLEGNTANTKTIGFVAHVDTVDVGLSPDIKPQLLHYQGEPLCLNEELGIYVDEKSCSDLAKYKGQDILFSDGTSVLGADDKAAVSVMMTLAKEFSENQTKRGDVYFAFVPDEEIGLKGAKLMPIEAFPVDYCYTIDCSERGEVVYETFNAGQAVFDITGITAHPMSAKNVLVNPNLIANDIMNLVTSWGLPEQTEGREGYFWVVALAGDQNNTKVTIHIRDFDLTHYNLRKQYLNQIENMMKQKHPKATISLSIEDVYSNISQSMGEDTSALDNLYQALKDLDIPAKTMPMRGGTDGSALSAMGLFTPNFFTGAHNFHSKFEFLPIPSFVDSYNVAKRLVELTIILK